MATCDGERGAIQWRTRSVVAVIPSGCKYVANTRRSDEVAVAWEAPALAWHRAQPGYVRTPLIDLATVGSEFGFERLWAKDETSRFGLSAFKVLGAAWAVEHKLGAAVAAGEGPGVLVAATDGNHGRAVAAVAAKHGLVAEIFVPRDTSEARVAAIEREGGVVHAADGGFDGAVQVAVARAEALGSTGLLVSDTGLSPHDEIPRMISDGYLTLFAEVSEALEERGEEPPDLVLLPIGGGGIASAGVRWFRRVRGIRLVGVEPISAACAYASIAAGRPVTVTGDFDSAMVGLNAGTLSVPAWPDLLCGLDGALAIPDDENDWAHRMLRGAGIRSGDTGVAGLAGLKALVAVHREAPEVVPWLAGIRRPLVLVTEGEVPATPQGRV